MKILIDTGGTTDGQQSPAVLDKLLQLRDCLLRCNRTQPRTELRRNRLRLRLGGGQPRTRQAIPSWRRDRAIAEEDVVKLLLQVPGIECLRIDDGERELDRKSTRLNSSHT